MDNTNVTGSIKIIANANSYGSTKSIYIYI